KPPALHPGKLAEGLSTWCGLQRKQGFLACHRSEDAWPARDKSPGFEALPNAIADCEARAGGCLWRYKFGHQAPAQVLPEAVRGLAVPFGDETAAQSRGRHRLLLQRHFVLQ